MEQAVLDALHMDDGALVELRNSFHKSFINSLANYQPNNNGVWSVEENAVKIIDTFVQIPNGDAGGELGLGFVINASVLQLCLVERSLKMPYKVLDRQECEMERDDDMATVCKCCVKMVLNLPEMYLRGALRIPLVICSIDSIVYQQGLKQAYLIDGQLACESELCATLERCLRMKRLNDKIRVIGHLCEMACGFVHIVHEVYRLPRIINAPRVHCVVDEGIGISYASKTLDGSVVLVECHNLRKGLRLTIIDRQHAQMEQEATETAAHMVDLYTLERMVSLGSLAELVRQTVIYLNLINTKQIWTPNSLSSEDLLALVANCYDGSNVARDFGSPSTSRSTAPETGSITAVLNILETRWGLKRHDSSLKHTEYIKQIKVARTVKQIATSLVQRAACIVGALIWCIIKHQKEIDGIQIKYVSVGGRLGKLDLFQQELMHQLSERRVELIKGVDDVPVMCAIAATVLQ